MSKTRIIVDEKDNKKLVTNLYLQTNPPLENIQRIKLLFHDIHFLLHTWVLDVNVDAYLLFLKENIIFDTNRPFLKLEIFIDDITKTTIAQYIKDIKIDHHIECTLKNFIECESNASSTSIVTIKIFDTKISKSFEYLVNKCYEAHFKLYDCTYLTQYNKSVIFGSIDEILFSHSIKSNNVELNHMVSFYCQKKNPIIGEIRWFDKGISNASQIQELLSINFGKTIGYLHINEPVDISRCKLYSSLTSLDVYIIYNLNTFFLNNSSIHTLRLRGDFYDIKVLVENTQLQHLHLDNPYECDINKILYNNTHLQSFRNDYLRAKNYNNFKGVLCGKKSIKSNFRLIEIGSYNFNVIGIEKLILSKCKKVSITINISYGEILDLVIKYPDNLYFANLLSNSGMYLSSVILNYVNRILTKNRTLEFILDNNTNYYDRYTWV